MAKYSKKIGWQKYEDYIEKQVSSPFLTNIIKTIISDKLKNTLEEDYEEEDEDESNLEYYDEDESDEKILTSGAMLPLTPQLIEDISLISNFDCWIGHTNFDLTKNIKDKLDKTAGVEILKIWSRYRFFVGIGRMFDFTEVRNSIEKILLTGED
jgi:hypothetical protein